MNTKKLLIVAIALLLSTTSQAQFWKKVADRASKAAEETVLDKVDEKTSKKTSKAMDTIFDGDTKNQKKKSIPNQKQPSSDKTDSNNVNSSPRSKRTVKSAKDFMPGTKVLYSDTFSNDAIGDFPVAWNTNASAEVVTFEGEDTRWLKLAHSGLYTPDGITDISENATFEFDLYVGEDYSYFSGGISINLVEVNDRSKDFMKPNKLNGVHLWLHPTAVGSRSDTGMVHISNIVEGSKIIENRKDFSNFSRSNNLVHVSIWRQKTRIRIYIDDNKIWDLPRAFSDANYNSIVFSVGKGGANAHFYVANLRLAVAGEDKRHALLETGEFETNEILFDVGKASIQESSFSILNEIGVVLNENPKLKINIIGHTDSDGQISTNQLLSEMRAKSVKEYITDNYPIMGNRLKTMGEGASKPVASNDSNEGKRKNRRVQFIKVN